MLSKLIAFAPDRRSAIARMRRALDEYFIGGIKSNLGLFRRILDHPDFQEARIDTGFLDRLLSSPSADLRFQDLRFEDSLEKLAAVSAALFLATAPPKPNGQNGASTSSAAVPSAWKRAARFEGVGNE
jgi:acetyl-CoA carboxylase biotin carboxylase subunit